MNMPDVLRVDHRCLWIIFAMGHLYMILVFVCYMQSEDAMSSAEMWNLECSP